MQFSMAKIWSLSTIGALSALIVLAFAPQQINYVLQKVYPVQADFLTADEFGNGYVINKKQELVRIPADDRPVFTYSLLKYGRPTSVDVSNPLKVLLFYKDFNIIVLLDNTLSEKATLKLQPRGYLQVETSCTSLDNNIWIYDGLNYKLKKIDEQFNLRGESEDFSLLFPEPPIPTFMREVDNHLFVNVPDVGILVFDIYGTYVQTLPLKGLNTFQVIRKQIIYFKDGKLQSYHTQTLQNKIVSIPVLPNTQSVKILEQHLLLLDDKGLTLYAH